MTLNTGRRGGTNRYVAGAASVLSLVAAVGPVSFLVERWSVLRLANPVPVTFTISQELYPSWSPDGARIAYQSNQSRDLDIWVVPAAGGQPVNLTADHAGPDSRPSWSPDGSQIAFWRKDGGGLFIVPSTGGEARLVAKVEPPYSGAPQWSRDGTKLAFAARDPEGSFFEIVSLEGAASRRVPLPGQRGRRLDTSWSPDERFVAYIDVGDRDETTRLVVLRISDEESFEVTNGRTSVWNPIWSPDGRILYFISARGGSAGLWGQTMAGDGRPTGAPRGLPTEREIAAAALSADGTKLAFSAGRRLVANLWRIPILFDRPATWSDAEQLTFDEAFIECVDVSPDGRRLLTMSTRSGYQDLWVMPAGGGEMTPLTDDLTRDWCPRWSPDGREVAFYSYRRNYLPGNRDIWVMPAGGGLARYVTRTTSQEYYPAWSPDGRELLFLSFRDGNPDLWIAPAEGGEARRVTDDDAPEWRARWSPDGNWLAFDSGQRLWRIPSGGGQKEPVSDGQAQHPTWSRDGRRIYFQRAGNLWALSLEDGSELPLTDLVEKPGSMDGNTLATDGGHLYFSWREQQLDLWVMDVVQE